MALAKIRSANIWYQVIGTKGPWVVLIQGGRHMATDIEELAHLISDQGFRVLIHDRRNSGRSSINLDRDEPEEEGFIQDIAALLKEVDAPQCFIVGRSGGSRIALRFALKFPKTVSGLFLWGISAGKPTYRFLNEYYFGKNLRACRDGGMPAVCELNHFKLMIKASSENKNVLLSVDPKRFMAVMRRWKSNFAIGADYPVMGITDAQLEAITVPTKIMPYLDLLHPINAAIHTHEKIAGSIFQKFQKNDHALTRMDGTAAESFATFAAKLI